METIRSLLRRLTWIAVLVGAFAPAASADYRLDTGDVVEITVFGVAEFKRRMTVNVDGNLSVPFLGEVGASGLSLSELRRSLSERLLANGTIRNPDVTIELVEYRPFYISGDVSRPGAHPYRPGMTVRHAVALAGGYDALRFRSENPLLAAPDLQSQYDSLWTEFVKRQAHAISIQSDMDGKETISLASLREAPISPMIVEGISELETQDLKIRIADFRKEREFLERAMATTKETIAALEKAYHQQEVGIEQQSQAVERVAGGAAKSITPVQRLDEERRALASLRSQQMDTIARITQARRDHAELARKLDRMVDEHRSKLIQDLQTATVELERVKAQIRAAGEKLLYTGAVKAQMRRGGQGPEVVIYRKSANGPTKVPATEDTEVVPDDVLDVLIRPDQLVVSPAQKAQR